MHGIGVDVVSISRICRLVDKYGVKFVKRIVKNCDSKLKPESLAARWALKEAVVKATGESISSVEIGTDSPPSVCVNGYSIMSSISHDGDTAVAVAIAFRNKL